MPTIVKDINSNVSVSFQTTETILITTAEYNLISRLSKNGGKVTALIFLREQYGLRLSDAVAIVDAIRNDASSTSS